MLRSASLGLRHGSRSALISSGGGPSASVTATARIIVGKTSPSSALINMNHQRLSRPSHWRAMSSDANNNNKKEDSSQTKNNDESADKDGEDRNEIVLTPGETVVAASRLGMWAGILGFACACAYFIGKELIPTKMSPNKVFNGASGIIKNHPQVLRVYGEKLKFYGKDHGGHREGRRNFVEHTEYQSPDDGSKRTRVRFNLEGQFASAFCFAEVSSDMPSGEYVYILVQNKQSGRVITVQDNRAAITAKRLAGGNEESANAMQQLLGGGRQG